MQLSTEEKKQSWLDRPIFETISLNWEVILFGLILALAIFTRLYDLGARVMSHDESLHTYFSWVLFKRGEFAHTPLMHGPFQFHFLALVYFLFGDNDFTARIPAIITSIATIGFLWQYRRYLGRIGTLVAAFLFTFSPFMLYYGRYVRNESYVGLFGIITLWAVLRYLDTGKHHFLYWLVTATSLHFTTKETSFIYTAQVLLFLGFLFLGQITKAKWKSESKRKLFIWLLIATLIFAAGALGSHRMLTSSTTLDSGEVSAPLDLESDIAEETGQSIEPTTLIFGGLAVISFAIAFGILIVGYGWENLKRVRSFEVMLLLFALILPHLSAFPIRLFGYDPMDYTTMASLLRIGAFLLPLILVSFAAGLLWNPKQWLINVAIFYSIFILFFTTMFTNGTGFFSGLVGSLGYWLIQQGVERGSQPSYYYVLVQLPIYEYLVILGSLLAASIGIYKITKGRKAKLVVDHDSEEIETEDLVPFLEIEAKDPNIIPSKKTALILFAYWAVSSLIAYSVAGEKMPWLTFHIVLPMLLLTAWAIGYLIEKLNWDIIKNNFVWLISIIFPVFLLSLAGISKSLFSGVKPFQGKSLDQLETTSTFMFALMISIACLAGLIILINRNKLAWKQSLIILSLTIFSILGLTTIRASITASYINHDRATEFLVYAHSARGVKDVMEQVEDLSLRLTNGLAIEVAYDDDISWPFTWYLRNYYNQKFYGGNPTRDLRDSPIILVGDNNFSKVEPIVAQGYYQFNYIRMWWPIQDYFDLTPERIKNYFSDPALRSGILDIWFNRDYSSYGEATGRDFSLPNWSPADKMRMYIRKDIVAQLWDYGVSIDADQVIIDPYENKQIDLIPDQIIAGAEGGSIFNDPRGIALAPDGSIYVADSNNHRIVQILDGEMINEWGSFSPIDANGNAPAGKFYEPWSVAVSPDGEFVYVADTWNHRIQKFTSDGKFLSMWGFFAQSEDPFAFWGPRDIAIDANGNLYVSNTGNKRITIFDPDGNFISQFGNVGFGLGEFDEPVGVAVSKESGVVYVADTWNQRIQAFSPNGNNVFSAYNSWDITGWYGQSLDNKPFLTVGDDQNLYVADPELSRILVFDPDGEFLYYFGDSSVGINNIGIVSDLIPDGEGGLWVSDSQDNRLLHYTLP
ncbi:MAG: TIGR03663 family protein [Chloroflexi bacterium]|jgi:uncharacterized protein (TIGR03663 family)|nr:TIGR03663 family protein [Chloroflexota bacterium]MBT3669409.1 TIGR03663 family protein [Chloroflexota bacterium]MBT4003303.1 TIGR03663 family protein [Chloroflexota bacterium]MBT4304572.1 TIGR03663 family protein [Chloroflexota bacterium]MBT4534087.1 TIGR03663 family protein [Chloroflexota bacterium]